MIDFSTISKENLKELNKERATQLEKQTNGMMYEQPSECPIFNELRYNYGYIYLAPFLIHGQTGNKFELRINSNNIHLAFVGVMGKEERQKGTGSEMMSILTKIADKYNHSIDLEVDHKFGVSKRALKKFYKSFGFVPDKRDFKGSDCMTRLPKTKEEVM